MQVAMTGCGWVTPRVAGRIEDVLTVYSGAHDPPKVAYEPIPQAIFDQFPKLPMEAVKEPPVRLAAIALEIACAQAGINQIPSDRKSLVVGCALAGLGGMIDFANDVREQSPRFVSPIRFPQTVGNYICGALARCYDFRGPASTIACGSASSLEAIREAASWLVSGQADFVVAGGCETLSPPIVEALDLPEVRFADGACFFVLERESDAARRGAKILAVLPDPRLPARPGFADGSTVHAAGFRPNGALCIENWIGRTLGADAAASLAAAIGQMTDSAALGLSGTTVHTTSQTIIRVRGMSDAIYELHVTC